jgi:flavin reductase (DIM6/NTAB) family NADH-FMN oxidoreductase RutF
MSMAALAARPSSDGELIRMYFDMNDLDQKRSYKLLASTVVPRPIAWVVTAGEDGRPNAAPYSLFNFFSGFPPVICVGMGLRDAGPKDSLANIRRSGEFVINLVPEDLAQQMNTTAVPFPTGVNELEKAGLHTVPATKVELQRIESSPVALECKLSQVLDVDTTGVIVVGHVVGMHVRDEAVIDAARCYIDTPQLKLIGRMESPGSYTRTHERFSMRQLQVDEWEAQQVRTSD